MQTSSSALEEACLAGEAGGTVSPEMSGKEGGGASEQTEETREAAVT